MININSHLEAQLYLQGNHDFFMEIFLDDDWLQSLCVLKSKKDSNGVMHFNDTIEIKGVFNEDIKSRPFVFKEQKVLDGSLIFTMYGVKNSIRGSKGFSLFGSNYVGLEVISDYYKANQSLSIKLRDNGQVMASITLSDIKVSDGKNLQVMKMTPTIENFVERESISSYVERHCYLQQSSYTNVTVPERLTRNFIFYSFSPFGKLFPEAFILGRNPVVDDDFIKKAIEFACDVANITYDTSSKKSMAKLLALVLSCVASSMEYVRDSCIINGQPLPKEEFWALLRAGDCEDSANVAVKLHCSISKHVSKDPVVKSLVSVANMYDACLTLISTSKASVNDVESEQHSSHMIAVLIQKTYFRQIISDNKFQYEIDFNMPTALLVEGTGIVDPNLDTLYSDNSSTTIRRQFSSGKSMRSILYHNDMGKKFYQFITVLYNPVYTSDTQEKCIFTATHDGKYGADINSFMNGDLLIKLMARPFPSEKRLLYNLSRIGPPTVDYTKPKSHGTSCGCVMCNMIDTGVQRGISTLKQLKSFYPSKSRGEARVVACAQLFTDDEFISQLTKDLNIRNSIKPINFDYKLYEIGETRHFVLFI